MSNLLGEAQAALKSAQELDLDSISREHQLGQELNFAEIVPEFTKIVEFLKRLELQYLDLLPDNELDIVRTQATQLHALYDRIMNFSSTANNPSNDRRQIIDEIKQFYPNLFRQMHPLISYFASRQRDFAAIERQARTAIADSKSKADFFVSQLEEQKQQADRILDEVRRVAAETGVSQHADIFRAEAGLYEKESAVWLSRLIYSCIAFVVFAALSLTSSYLQLLAPTTAFQAISINASKLMIAAGIGFLIVLSGKNFLAAKHNNVVNRHRLNALRTFQVFVKAAKTEENRDIVLNYAAACIFSPQETGFTRGGQQIELPAPLMQTLTRASNPAQ